MLRLHGTKPALGLSTRSRAVPVLSRARISQLPQQQRRQFLDVPVHPCVSCGAVGGIRSDGEAGRNDRPSLHPRSLCTVQHRQGRHGRPTVGTMARYCASVRQSMGSAFGIGPPFALRRLWVGDHGVREGDGPRLQSTGRIQNAKARQGALMFGTVGLYGAVTHRAGSR